MEQNPAGGRREAYKLITCECLASALVPNKPVQKCNSNIMEMVLTSSAHTRNLVVRSCAPRYIIHTT